jgi:cysteate synthase
MTHEYYSPQNLRSSAQATAVHRHYRLRCSVCSAVFDDDGFVLQCPVEHTHGLLVTDYAANQFEREEHDESIYRYWRWLPMVRRMSGAGRTMTYRSAQLSVLTGLPNLWIAFNGYWPEKGAALQTATFKELEACAVLSRIPQGQNGVLVVASAGNTAAAFCRMCSENEIACLIVIPERALNRMRVADPVQSSVRIACLGGSADYYDAITVADRISRVEGFFAEGGVKNVARRDGLGTTLLNAVEAMGQLPEYYFQAVGSGCGGIAVFEAAKRLVAGGNFGQRLPRLMLSQNSPFCPMYDSWKSGQRGLIELRPDVAKAQIRNIMAGVLSNRNPCYSVRGGVYDALMESRGDMLVATNQEALAASRLFNQSEGIDIDPAAAVALATLIKASRFNRIPRQASVLLHITGGGWLKRSLESTLIPARPALTIGEGEVHSDTTFERLVSLFR